MAESDLIKALYGELSSTIDLGDYTKFEQDLSTNDAFRKAIFDEASKTIDLGDYSSFEGSVKKKESSFLDYLESGQKSAFGLPPSPEPSKESLTQPQPLESPKKDTGTYAGDILERIGAGFLDLATSGPKRAKFAQKLMGIPKEIAKKELSLLGLSEERASKIAENIPYITPPEITTGINISKAVWDKIGQTEGFKDIEQRAVELRENSARYDKLFSEYLKDKQIGKALGVAVLSGAESLPMTLEAYFGGPVGLADLGFYAASAQYDQLDNRTDMKEVQKLSNALANGTMEILTEKLGSANYGKLLKNLYKSVGKEQAEQTVKSALKTWLSQFWKRFGIYTAPAGEAIEEGINQLGGNLTARITGEDTDRPLDYGVIDAMGSGLGGGAFFVGPGMIAQARGKYYEAKLKEKEKLAKEKAKESGTTDKGTAVTEVGGLEVPESVRKQFEEDNLGMTKEEVKEMEEAPQKTTEQEEGTEPAKVETKTEEEITDAEGTGIKDQALTTEGTPELGGQEADVSDVRNDEQVRETGQQEEVVEDIGDKNIKNNFDLREEYLSLQKQKADEEIRKDQGGVAQRELGQPEFRGEDVAGKPQAQPRYDIGGSERIPQDASIKSFSLSDKEVSDLSTSLPTAVFDKSFSEVNDADLFHKSISQAQEGNKYGASVWVYKTEEYKNSRLFLSEDGKAGLAITPEGDIISVFTHGEGKGRVPQLIINAIKEGAVSLDNYNTVLTGYYAQFGFVPVARVKWDDSQAPPKWDKKTYEKYNNGEPDVVAMAYHGGDPNTLSERVGKFGEFSTMLENTPYVKDWDEAKALQKKYVERLKRAEVTPPKVEQVIQNDIIEYESKRQPREDRNIDKKESDNLLSKARKATGYFAQRVKEITDKYLVFPIRRIKGYRGNVGYEYAFLPKPNENTGITMRYRDFDTEKQWGEPVLYDKSIVNENGEIIDKRYVPYDKDYETEKENDPEHLFRGMSGEEFDDAVNKGKIESNKNMNFENQQEITSFAQYQQQAFSYAYGFTAWHDNPTFDNPRYVVRVKREGLNYSLNEVGEADVKGSVPLSNITDIWEIRLTESEGGRFDLIEEEGQFREQSRTAMGGKVAIRKLSKDEVSLIKGEKPVEIPVETKTEPTEAVPPPSEVTPPPTEKVAEKPLKDENLPEYTIGVRALNSNKLDQDIKDAIAKEGINYIPRGRTVRAEEAQEIIRLFSQEPNGLDKIELAVRDTKNDIPPDTRTYLSAYLASEYVSRRDATTEPAERNLYKDKVVSMLQFGMEQGKIGGQLVESQKEWGKIFGNSPDIAIALVQKHINDKNRGFFTTHEEEIQATKKLLDDIFGSEEGRVRIEQEVQAEIEKIGTKNFGAESKKKIDDFFNGLLIDPKRQNLYGGLLGIPVAAWNGSVLAVKNAVLLGVDIASAIQKGVEYLDKWHKDEYAKGKIASPDWNKAEYQSHMKEKLGGLKKEVPVKEKPTTKRKVKPKTLPTSEEVLNKVLEKMAGFATKKQLQNFIKDYIQEHTEKGYVDDQRYKDLLAKALGLDYISDKVQAEITANARALGHAQKKVQEVIDAFEKLLALDPKSREFADLRKQLDVLKKEADKAQFNAQKANMEIKKLLSEEPELLDKMGTLIQGSLLVSTSIIRNVYGNVFLAPARATRYTLMNVMDWMLSYTSILADEARAKIDPVKHPDLYRFAQKLPSRERTVDISGSAKGYREGVWSGFKEGLVQLKTGQLEDDYKKKEIQRGLEPIKAMMRIRDSLTGVEKRRWDKLVGDILEALPSGYMGEAMFRLLNLGDKPFRRAAEQARLSEIASIKGLTGLRREQFMNNPDNASLAEAQKAGDYAVYTNDNFVSKIIEYANQTFKKGAKSKTDALKSASIIGKALFKLGKATTLPYVRTPVNLAIETFEYAIPMYSLGRGFEAMYKGNRRESLDYFSKAIVGAMISSVAITLLKSGIMTPAGSDDDKLRQAEFTAKEGYRLNIDALQRKISGENPSWQDGDNTVTLKGYGTLSMILMAYGAAYKDKTPEEMGQESITERWATVFGSVVSSALEQSIMTGVNTALQAALKGEKERDRWLVNTATALSTVVYPSTLASISKTFTDENYLRETRDLSVEEDQLRTQMINTFKDRMFMGKGLPTKVSIWGEPVKIIPDGETWAYNLLGVSKNKKYQKYSFGTRMYELYEEYKKTNPDEAKSIFPSLPSPGTKVGWEKSKMTPEQLQNYQIRVGELRAEFAENYVNSEEFVNADIEDRILTLTNMYSKARRRADSEMFRWSTFQQTVPDKWKVLLDNDAVPIPSAIKVIKMGNKSFDLEPDDVRKLNEIALDRYAERLTPYIEGNKDRLVELKKVNEKTGKIPFVEKANGAWDDAIEYAKKQMAILLRGKAE